MLFAKRKKNEIKQEYEHTHTHTQKVMQHIQTYNELLPKTKIDIFSTVPSIAIQFSTN